jgi:hypothetical protein
MKRTIIVVAVALLTVLAGCSGVGGGGADPAAGESGDSDSGESAGGDSSGDSGTDAIADSTEADSSSGSSADAGSASELRMFQFDQVERYEYRVSSFGNEGDIVVSVESVTDGTARVRIEFTMAGQDTQTRTYEVPAGDADEFIVEAQAETYAGAVFILQSEDATSSFIANDIEWAVGNTYEDETMDGNISVTGRETIAGVECLTYETYISDTLIQEGCVTADLELAVSMTQYLSDGTVRSSLTLTNYEQG